jgi:hypothetical protein
MGQSFSSVSYKPISNLSTAQLRDLKKQIDRVLSDKELNADPYSAAHLSEASVRIEKALDAGFIYNTSDIGGGGASVRLILGNELKRSAN